MFVLPGMLFTLQLESPRGVEAGLVNHLPKPHSEGGAEPDSNPGPNDHKTSGLSVQRFHRSKKQLNLVFSPSSGKVLLIYSEIKCWRYGILSKTTATSERTVSIYGGCQRLSLVLGPQQDTEPTGGRAGLDRAQNDMALGCDDADLKTGLSSELEFLCPTELWF